MWPTFVYTNLETQTSIPSRRQMKTCWRKIKKMLLVVRLSSLRAKQLFMKLLFESLLTYAYQMLGLMLANFIHIRCVNPCPPVLILVGIWIQRPVFSPLADTRPVVLKRRSCPIFNEQDQIAKLRASSGQADGRKLTDSVMTVFVRIATLRSKP